MAGEIGDFATTLYPLIVTNADDWGRLSGDAFSVRCQCYPGSRRGDEDFEFALRCMADVGLIILYDVADARYLQIVGFEDYQDLKGRTKSKCPAPPGVSSFEASEAEVESIIAERLVNRSLRIGDLRIVTVDRQVRVGNSYLDIVCKTKEGPTVIIEVKRQRVSISALDQVRRYVDLLRSIGVSDVLPVVIGYGIATNLPLTDTGILVAVYDDELRFSAIASTAVNGCHLTVDDGHAPSDDGPKLLTATEPNRTEPNRTEPNLTSDIEKTVLEGSSAAPRADGSLDRYSISSFEFDSWFERIRDVTGEPDTKAKRALYRYYLEALGPDAFGRALSTTNDRKLNPDARLGPLRNAGAYLNDRCKDIAVELKIPLGRASPPSGKAPQRLRQVA